MKNMLRHCFFLFFFVSELMNSRNMHAYHFVVLDEVPDNNVNRSINRVYVFGYTTWWISRLSSLAYRIRG